MILNNQKIENKNIFKNRKITKTVIIQNTLAQ